MLVDGTQMNDVILQKQLIINCFILCVGLSEPLGHIFLIVSVNVVKYHFHVITHIQTWLIGWKKLKRTRSEEKNDMNYIIIEHSLYYSIENMYIIWLLLKILTYNFGKIEFNS